MQVITSKENERVKQIRKLKEKKQRDLEGLFIIEGMKLVQEAIQEGAEIETIVVCEDCIKDEKIEQKMLYEIAKYECIYVSQKVFYWMSDVSNPQGILAIIRKKNQAQKINYKEDILIALDGIQDPGNLGTILRTIDSVGLSQVLLSKNSVDPYNPKVVRSTMGAIFRVNMIETENFVLDLKEAKKHKFEILATSLEESKSIYEVEYRKKVIVIGNEANGVSREILDIADQKIKIPMIGKTESLNASVATGIILYEYVREKILLT